MSTRRLLRILPLVSLLVVSLSACTVYVRPGAPETVGGPVGVPLQHVITVFEPGRGNGSTYYVGEAITFRIRALDSGYVTLTAMDPDGRVYVIARNVFVPAGRTVVLPTPQMRVRFTAAPPTGLHRVRASFTSSRTNAGHGEFSDRHGERAWTQAIDGDIRGYPVRDVAETTLYIR